jgi:hypothetical protein
MLRAPRICSGLARRVERLAAERFGDDGGSAEVVLLKAGVIGINPAFEAAEGEDHACRRVDGLDPTGDQGQSGADGGENEHQTEDLRQSAPDSREELAEVDGVVGVVEGAMRAIVVRVIWGRGG